MKYSKKYLASMALLFVLSLITNIAAKNYETTMIMSNCYICNTGTCIDQTGGSGFTYCEDASPGGTICGIAGTPCCVGIETCVN